MSPTQKELFYNSISDSWGTLINTAETDKRLEIVFNKLLKGRRLTGKKLLEVGCGLGFFSKKASDLGAKVTGIDVGERLVKICRKKVPKGKFIKASAQKLPFKSNSFDIVLCTEVIEHVEDPISAITELKRVVKKGGYIVLTTPNKLFKPLFNFMSTLHVRPYHGNENWFSFSDLRNVFKNNGLIIKEDYYFNFIYPVPIFDYFERFKIIKKFMINQGYLLLK